MYIMVLGWPFFSFIILFLLFNHFVTTWTITIAVLKWQNWKIWKLKKKRVLILNSERTWRGLFEESGGDWILDWKRAFIKDFEFNFMNLKRNDEGGTKCYICKITHFQSFNQTFLGSFKSYYSPFLLQWVRKTTCSLQWSFHNIIEIFEDAVWTCP